MTYMPSHKAASDRTEMRALTERRYLAPRGMTYVFSMQFDYEFVDTPHPQFGASFSLQLDRDPPKHEDWDTYHILGQDVVWTKNQVLSLPDASIIRGACALPVTLADATPFEGKLVLQTNGRSVLAMDHRGLIHAPGGTAKFSRGAPDGPKSGSVRTAFRCWVETAALRWMTLNQLIGVGKWYLERVESADDSTKSVLRCDFDLYVAF